MLFSAAASTGRPRPWQIVAGQYLGIAALVGASLAAALGLALVPDDQVGWLGLIPLALGLRGLARTLRSRDGEATAPVVAGVVPIMALTIANGADNVAVYTPLLRTMPAGQVVLTVVVFAVLVAVWLFAGSNLGSHRRTVGLIDRAGHWIVPTAFVLIGLAILLESGVLRA